MLRPGTSTLTAAGAAVLIRLAAIATLGWSRLDPTAGLVLEARPSSKGSTPDLPRHNQEERARPPPDIDIGVFAGIGQAVEERKWGANSARIPGIPDLQRWHPWWSTPYARHVRHPHG